MTFRTSAVRAALAITIGAAALGVAACTAPGTAKQTAAPQAGTSDINEKPREQLKPGGTLRLSIQQWISQYNVGQVDGTQGDGQDILALTQPELWFRDEHGSISRNPDVLASAEVTATSPRQVVTYRINPKAIWSDGTPITWRDFETQWKTRNGSAKAFTVSSTAGYDLITGVAKGADDREVKVTFGTPHADWQALFDPLLPGSALDTPQKFNTGWIEKIPVWAGPWKIGSLDKTAQTITVVPNDKYWGVKPVLGAIIFRALDSSAITDAYLNKEIDQAPARTPETYKRLSGAPGTAIRIGSRWDETHLTLGDAGPLADIRVRQAISIGLDRAAIARAASTDLPFKLQPLGNHFFMPAQSGYRDNSADYGRFDPAKAKKLLDEAGWTSKGDAPRARNGKALTLTYIVNSGGSNDIPQLVQNLLGKIGIGVELKQVPRNEFFEKYVNTGTFDLVSFRNVDVLFPSDNLPTFRTGGEQNYGKVAAPEVDALLAKAAAETDPAAAGEPLQQGRRTDLEERPFRRAVPDSPDLGGTVRTGQLRRVGTALESPVHRDRLAEIARFWLDGRRGLASAAVSAFREPPGERRALAGTGTGGVRDGSCRAAPSRPGDVRRAAGSRPARGGRAGRRTARRRSSTPCRGSRSGSRSACCRALHHRRQVRRACPTNEFDLSPRARARRRRPRPTRRARPRWRPGRRQR